MGGFLGNFWGGSKDKFSGFGDLLLFLADLRVLFVVGKQVHGLLDGVDVALELDLKLCTPADEFLMGLCFSLDCVVLKSGSLFEREGVSETVTLFD